MVSLLLLFFLEAALVLAVLVSIFILGRICRFIIPPLNIVISSISLSCSEIVSCCDRSSVLKVSSSLLISSCFTEIKPWWLPASMSFSSCSSLSSQRNKSTYFELSISFSSSVSTISMTSDTCWFDEFFSLTGERSCGK